jgi:hypothetical protein
LRLGFWIFFCLYLYPNLVSSPIEGILEIFNLTPSPGAFRWIFWHGRIVSDQVQVRFHIQTYFLIQICKNIDISLLLQRTSDKIIQTSLRTALLLNSRTTPHEQKSWRILYSLFRSLRCQCQDTSHKIIWHWHLELRNRL